MDDHEISDDDIVTLQRRARFGATTDGEWARRLESLISAQPDVLGKVRVANVRAVETKAGGSNGTLFFNAEYRTKAGLETEQFVLRFLPVQGLFHRYDVRGQFELQRTLAATAVPVGPQMWLDEDGTHLTRPGYVMRRVEGECPPFGWRSSGLFANAAPQDRREMMLEHIHVLAKIHALDWRGLGLDWLQERASGQRPQEREANWYWDALQWVGAKDELRALGPVRAWLVANEPEDLETVLCHGDTNYGNYLFKDNKITAVLDWEMAFLGAPEMDLVSRLAFDEGVESDLPWPEGAPTHEELFAEYERVSGRQLRHIDYFRVFCAYRSAVISTLAAPHFPAEVRPSFMPRVKRYVEHAQELLTQTQRTAS